MIIVTGAAGFIGSHMVKYLNSIGENDICIVDDLTIEKNINLQGCEYKQHYSIEDFYNTFNDWDKVSLIFHEGGVSSTVEKDKAKFDKFNVESTKYLIEKAIKYDIVLSYASSASVYGTSQTFLETDSMDPKSPYATSKSEIDDYVMKLTGYYRIQGWRYFNVYGKNENHKQEQASPISKFLKQAVDTNEIKIFKKSQDYKRDFVCVDDVVKVKYMATQSDFRGVCNLGTGIATSFKDIADIISAKTGATIKEIEMPKNLKEQYQAYTCADMTKFRLIMNDYKFTSFEKYLLSL